MFIRKKIQQQKPKKNRLAPNHRLFSTAFHQHPNYAWASKKWPILPQQRVVFAQFDLAGTLVDEFCIAPFDAFSELFLNLGFNLTPEQITGPMGLKKIEHIKHLLEEIREEWREKYGRYPGAQDAENLNQTFNQLLQKSLPKYTALTPKAELALDFIFKHLDGYALTTGYPRAAANIAMSELIKKYPPMAITTSDEVSTRIGMVEANNRKCHLTQEERRHVIFFTDAGSDVESLRSANEYPWTIGISGASTHNEIISLETAKKMSPELRQEKRTKASDILYKKGAHCVIEDLSELPLALVAVNHLIQDGLKPKEVNTFELPSPNAEFANRPKKNV